MRTKLRFPAIFVLIAALACATPARATIQSATIDLSIVSTMLNALNVVTGTAPLNFQQTYRISNGSSANQANVFWSDKRTLSASASETLEINGSLNDAFGATLDLTAVKALLVCADSGNTNNVVVGDAASDAWSGLLGATGTATIQPGGCLLAVAPGTGYAVANGSTDNLKIANSSSGTGVTYTIVILGVE